MLEKELFVSCSWCIQSLKTQLAGGLQFTALGFLPKCPYLNSLLNLEDFEAQDSLLVFVKTECFHSISCFEAPVF